VEFYSHASWFIFSIVFTSVNFMLMLRLRLIALVVLVVLASVSGLPAQWVSIAPNLIGTGPHQNSGAMLYQDGVAWAGLYQLFKSTDKGQSWQVVSTFPSLGTNTIHGIVFHDRNTGFVCTDVGLYLTHDQGATWKQFYGTTTVFTGAFCGNSTSFAAGVYNVGAVVTTDDGAHFTEHAIGRVAKDFFCSTPGQITAFIESVTDSHIATTTDYGVTWTEKSGLMDPDSHAFGVTACDDQTIYGINEEGGNYTSNNLSEIFKTTDGGGTWTSIKQTSLATMSGCVLITPGAIYVPARSGGILQSVDQGKTWTTITGPNVPIDSRDLIAIDDTILLAADVDGTIWRAINPAGRGNFSSGSSTLNVTTSNERNDSVGGTVKVPINFTRNGVLSSLDFLLHFEYYQGLTYLGSFTTGGKQIDVANSTTKGRSQLHLDAADLPASGPSLVGYSLFKLYIGEGGCAKVWYDSLQFATPPSACFSYAIDSASSIVCSNQTLRQAVSKSLAQFANSFTLSPNPVNNSTTLRSSVYSGMLNVRIVNTLGATVSESLARVDSHAPMQLHFDGLPAGEYFLRVEGEGVHETMSVIRMR
jgi:photosystem II stability/assembly factor-like uncharacterized protein